LKDFLIKNREIRVVRCRY